MKKGFTLVELIGVIALLGILALIAVPIINSTIKGSKEKAYTAQVTSIEDAAKKWGIENTDKLPTDSGYMALTLTKLVEEKYLSDDKIKDPRDDSEMTGCVIIRYINTSNNYNYYYSDTCTDDTNIYANGKTFYFNPETNKACTSSEAVSTTGTKIGCMKWYSFNYSGSNNVNLILDHNTTALVAWNSSGKNTDGMKEVLDKLKTDTTTWNTNLKIRLIKADEVASITNNQKFNGSSSLYSEWFYFDTNTSTQSSTCMVGNTTACKYGWLYDRTYIKCQDYGCLNNSDASNTGYGYWTSTPVHGYEISAWRIDGGGMICNGNVKSTDLGGVRPVITVSKSLLS